MTVARRPGSDAGDAGDLERALDSYARFLAHQLGEVAVLVGAGTTPTALTGAASRLDRMLADFHDLSAQIGPTATLDLAAEAGAVAERLTTAHRPVRAIADGALPQVHADPALLTALLCHIMRPAIAASRTGVTFTLNAKTVKGERVLVELTDDSGPVSDEEARRRLLPFERPSGSGSLLGAGVSGPAARRIVAAHGGDIGARGGAEGVVVEFDLPAGVP